MSKTLRLLMPQWQGGNNPAYYFGAKLLAHIAPPDKNSIEVEVPVEPYNGIQLQKENGVTGQSELLKQLKSAQQIIELNKPEKIIVFGGDCLVTQAPIAYLNEIYNGKLGVLWLDAHPDVSTPADFHREHAMVLGNLLGEGDPKFSSEVTIPLNPKLVMYGGLQKTLPYETAVINRLGLRFAGPDDLAETSAPVINWINENKIDKLFIHFDLDVLSPNAFRSLLFTNPQPIEIDAQRGEMTFKQISRLMEDVSQKTDIVGLGITEYMPWDAINLNMLMSKIPIFG